MRGRYNINNTDLILKLFMQMTPEEIDDINNKDFDYLWNNLWDSNNIKNKYHHKEYLNSKEKFYQLKLKNNNLIQEIKPSYNFNEWGFPKGRRELYESDIVCAIREFEEETYIKEDDYLIFDKCKSIRENLIGTNGINYTHNYFLALIQDNNIIFDNKSNREIGNIEIMNIKDCIELIRPYHTEKIKIIKTIYILINYFIKEYENIEI
jgi:8-oxo-dGTP pyrophosphatase MutT (NUDIX family)